MTEDILNLVPSYGLFLIFGVIVLSCLAAPLPASMLVLASGGFVASGDLVLAELLCVTFTAFLIGDQLAFRIARNLGPSLLGRLRRNPRIVPIVARSEALLARRGQLAVIMSHTIISPTCPYVSYLCGAGGMAWRPFTFAAVFGAAVWTGTYVTLGYMFASQLTQVVDILADFFGITLAGLAFVFCGFRLRKLWRDAEKAD